MCTLCRAAESHPGLTQHPSTLDSPNTLQPGVCVCVCAGVCLGALLLPPVPLPYHLTAVLRPTQLTHLVWLLASTVRGGGVWSMQCPTTGAALKTGPLPGACMPCTSTPPPASSCRPAAAPGRTCKMSLPCSLPQLCTPLTCCLVLPVVDRPHLA